MEGPLDDCGPLQAAYDKRVGPWSLGLHQLAFCRQRKNRDRTVRGQPCCPGDHSPQATSCVLAPCQMALETLEWHIVDSPGLAPTGLKIWCMCVDGGETTRQ